MADQVRVDGDSSPVLFVHPDDVPLPEIKARAAELGANVVGSRYVPRGQAYLARPDEIRPPYGPVDDGQA